MNHNLVPLNYKLKSGDQVEVITSKIQNPKHDWLKLVVTARAKSRIKQAVRDERKAFKKQGEKKLIGFFEQLNIEYNNKNRQLLQDRINYPGTIDLFYFVAINKIVLKDIKQALNGNDKSSWLKYLSNPFGKSKNSDQQSISTKIRENIRTSPESLLLEGSILDLNYEISK